MKQTEKRKVSSYSPFLQESTTFAAATTAVQSFPDTRRAVSTAVSDATVAFRWFAKRGFIGA